MIRTGEQTMTQKLCGIVFFVLISCMTCFGQTSFQGLTPGESTRNDVEQELGQPVRTISATVFEYSPPPGIARVEVAYNAGSSLVERFEVYFLKPVFSRTALFNKLSLPPQADAKKTNAEGKLVEYFGGSSLLALTYASADPGSGISHIGYYSRELFERVTGIPSGATQPSNPVRGHRECFADDPGMASTTRTEIFNWAQRQSVARLEANLASKINLLFNCPSMSNDQLSSAFADLSVVIANELHNYTCFAGDPGSLSEDLSGHKEWARTRSRGEILNNLQWKVRTALKCLVIHPSPPNRWAQSSLFAAISRAIREIVKE
jgi:hypothetical protein